MKKTLKSAFALLLAFSLIMSMTGIVMAADSDFVSSHVVFLTTTSKDGTKNYIAAEAFVRNYSSSTSDAILFCAVYEAGGKLAGVSSADGVNTVLRTEYVEIGDGCTAKAFVWEKTNQKIISNIARYGANSLTDASLEIKFDGQSFESYIGEDFSWDKTAYTKALTATDGVVTYPVVTAKLAGYTDNTASVKVVNDFETSKTTTITVEIGQRTETDSTTNVYNSVDNSVAQKVYSKPATKTFTITYTEPTVITDDAVELTTKDYYTPDDLKYTVSKTYTANGVTKVSVPFTNSSKGMIIFVVKPANGSDRDVIVNENGTALTWTDYHSSANKTDYYVGEGIVGQAAAGGAKLDGADIPVFPETMNSDNNFVTGTMLATNRRPTDGAYGIYYLPAEYVGYNYIVLPWQRQTGTIEFYVNQDVDVTCFCSKKFTMDSISQSEITDCPKARINADGTLTVPFRAYLTAHGIIDENDIASYSSGSNIYLTWNAIENKVKPYMINTFGSSAGYKAVQFKSTYTLDGYVSEGAVASGVTYSDLADIWLLVDNSSIKVIKNLAKAETNNYAGVARILTPETSMYTNRAGWTEETKNVGGIVSYPEVMELEGSEVIAFNNGLEPAAGSSIELYTFVAGCDAELIYAGTADNDELVADGWIKLLVSPSENFSYVKYAATSRWAWYAKKVSKGDKVTIKSDGTKFPPVVVARPIN